MKKSEFFLESYSIKSDKINPASGEIRFCFLSDLHGSVFGENNRKILKAVSAFSPDGILVGGDMVVSKKSPRDSVRSALLLMESLSGKYPVWYGLGNHEYRMMKNSRGHGGIYADYEEKLLSMGIQVLHNESSEITVKGSRLRILGLELEEAYYRKPFSPALTREHMETLLGKRQREADVYEILLAHSPLYGDTYFVWGSDLILSGHYHGGLMRLTRRQGLISPQFHPFPRYCCGDFQKGEQRMIVSSGLGEHTLPLRIHNPRVLVQITISPKFSGR